VGMDVFVDQNASMVRWCPGMQLQNCTCAPLFTFQHIWPDPSVILRPSDSQGRTWEAAERAVRGPRAGADLRRP
jgi:hypothetical protein